MKGNNAKNAIDILKAATSNGSKTSNPFLMKKNEKPQTIEIVKKFNQSLL